MRSTVLVCLLLVLVPFSAATAPQTKTTTVSRPAHVVTATTPKVQFAKADPLTQMVSIVATLGFVQNQILKDPAAFDKSSGKVLDATKKLAALWLSSPSSPPECDPGFCPEGGICVPCYPPGHKGAVNAQAAVATLNMIQHRIMRDYLLDRPTYDARFKETSQLTAQAHELMFVSPSQCCGPGYCQEGQICVPCLTLCK